MSKYTAEDFRKTRFAEHPRSFALAVRSGTSGRHTHPWTAIPCGEGLDQILTDDELADNGWVPVQECPDLDYHTLQGVARAFAAVTPCSCSAQRARAEKAEDALALVQQQRDQATERAKRAERSRDLALARAERAECHDCGADAAVIEQPPARPEWADLADVIRGTTYHPEPDDLARALHHEGVRVVTEEGR